MPNFFLYGFLQTLFFIRINFSNIVEHFWKMKTECLENTDLETGVQSISLQENIMSHEHVIYEFVELLKTRNIKFEKKEHFVKALVNYSKRKKIKKITKLKESLVNTYFEISKKN